MAGCVGRGDAALTSDPRPPAGSARLAEVVSASARTRGSGIRGVAQLGRAPALGAGGRRFKSCRPDDDPHTDLDPRCIRARGTPRGERTHMVNSTVEQLSPTRVKLHITVTPEELKPSITHAYEH